LQLYIAWKFAFKNIWHEDIQDFSIRKKRYSTHHVYSISWLTKEKNNAQPMIGEVVHIYAKHENAMDNHDFMNVDSH
jgi:hypothetical protein